MENHFEKIGDLAALDNWIARSYKEPVVIFKHSDTCGISSRAYAEIMRLKEPIAIVTVQTERAISNEIESRFNLMHESPQVLVVRNGEIIWSGSHGQIKSEALAKAIDSVNGKQ